MYRETEKGRNGNQAWPLWGLAMRIIVAVSDADPPKPITDPCRWVCIEMEDAGIYPSRWWTRDGERTQPWGTDGLADGRADKSSGKRTLSRSFKAIASPDQAVSYLGTSTLPSRLLILHRPRHVPRRTRPSSTRFARCLPSGYKFQVLTPAHRNRILDMGMGVAPAPYSEVHEMHMQM